MLKFIFPNSTSSLKSHFSFLSFISLQILKFRIIFYILFSTSLLLINCAGSKRFTSDEDNKNEEVLNSNISSVRVLLDEKPSSLNITLSNKVHLLNETNKVAEINKGNQIKFTVDSKNIITRIGRKTFTGEYFQIISDNGELIRFNGKTYKGNLRIVAFGNYVNIVNFVGLEDYLRGVIAKEMPIGNGEEYYEALKAFTICARTYAVNKMNEGKKLFDIFPDTRDQVYGGETAEELISNRAVEETKGIILNYNDKLAKVYYHSTCGGMTENVENVFPQSPVPYLISIKDGNEPFCKISPRYEWEEIYNEDQFIKQLYNAKLISNQNYSIVDINITRRFNSGRVDELEIILNGGSGRKVINLYGNEIRSIFRTSERNLSLWSIMFNVEINSDGKIKFIGKGFGHGVGLCQWGAIGQSKEGKNFENILKHYFPGTELGKIYDPS